MDAVCNLWLTPIMYAVWIVYNLLQLHNLMLEGIKPLFIHPWINIRYHYHIDKIFIQENYIALLVSTHNSIASTYRSCEYNIRCAHLLHDLIDYRARKINSRECNYSSHDDVIKWKHFPRYWPFVRRIHRSPVNCQHKGQWRGALMFSLICAWINAWLNNREDGDLMRHCADYDVMEISTLQMYVQRP